MLSMAQPKMSEPNPGTTEVRAIVAIEDIVIRNLRITECYARLSAAVRAHVGEGANWCSFARGPRGRPAARFAARICTTACPISRGEAGRSAIRSAACGARFCAAAFSIPRQSWAELFR